MPAPKANAIVELLRASAPERLTKLQEAFPNEVNLLSEGLPLGPTSGFARSHGVLCELTRAGLEEAKNEVAAILLELPKRAIRAKRIRLAGAVLATVISAGVVSSAIFGDNRTTIITALISFAATTIGLVANYLETPLFGTKGIAELIEDCLRLEMESQNAAIELQRQLRDEAGDCSGPLSTTNEICAKLRRIRIFGGMSDSAG
ncbi:hypothetical protein [Bradyrhizobium sp. CCGE-LA001]|uniref:hypothetical protein n=1 Tax=Bradyrhizobium sp. CCGE-LA001 TaxID=1223566 RepID=UPI001198278F|nr:hypothetical protein [Bradyrhizobium sp. CCGE-LA001]